MCVRDVGERETRRGVVGRKRESEREEYCVHERGRLRSVCERQCVCV
jgi:hypothetical protein